MIANMCGRYVVSGDTFGIGAQDNFNVSPGAKVPVKTLNCDGQIVSWGLEKAWSGSKLIINARSETYLDKYLFRNSVKCIVPHNGWIEWANDQNTKKPYYLYTDRPYFAGLLVEDKLIILTKQAESNISFIHNRQPVLINKYDVGDWFMGLNAFKDQDKILFHEISKEINNPNHNNQKFLNPV